jgi:hypothetical protein
MPRRRVGLIKSFKIANEATPGVGDASFWTALLVGFWWWIVGIPEETPGDEPPQQPERKD